MDGKKHKRNQEIIELAGRNIRKHRERLKLSQTELAFLAETDYTQISNMENAKTNSSISHYVNVAKALGVSVGILLGEIEE